MSIPCTTWVKTKLFSCWWCSLRMSLLLKYVPWLSKLLFKTQVYNKNFITFFNDIGV
jgi:hypothetical protein